MPTDAPRPDAKHSGHGEARQRALQAELGELVDLVTPIELVDVLLERAYQLRTTDIHFDPQEGGLRVRMRIDGMLHDMFLAPVNVASQMLSRIKLLSGMDIAEKRLAQDGRINYQFLGQRRDIRVGSGPTTLGERAVLRLMPDHESFRTFAELGFDENEIQTLRSLIRRPYGMVLSVGPVGSGKSTTMYSCLEELNAPHRSLVTIEDPVERRIPGVAQTQIDMKLGFGFVDALRAVLRQDPNVMMIGEIRDADTASIGVRAGRTGILVLSTMHANDTISAIDVFRDYGIAPMFISDSLQGILSQRLLRRVCVECRQIYEATPAEKQILGIDPTDSRVVELVRGKGCELCFGTGYKGRTGVFELLVLDGEVRDAILNSMPRNELIKLCAGKGMRTLKESAIHKVLDRTTSIEEMNRVLVAESVE